MPEFKTIEIDFLINELKKIKQSGKEELTLDSDFPHDMKLTILRGLVSLNIDTFIKTLESAKRIGEEELIIHTNLSYNTKAMIVRGRKNHPLIYRKLA